jgi:N-acetylneuraminic acid mutarotase
MIVSDCSTLASAEIYNPSTNTWSSATSATYAVYSHTATLLSNNLVLIAGGGNCGSPIIYAQLYNYSSNSWAVKSMATARMDHAAVLSGGNVYVMGG